MNTWQTSRFALDLSEPRVMGIVNVTPDSFSDGGSHASASAALHHCEQLLKDGAHILDIGGESTRPGSPAVPLEEGLAECRVKETKLRADRRLGQPQFLRRFRDAAFPDDGPEIQEVVIVQPRHR